LQGGAWRAGFFDSRDWRFGADSDAGLSANR
jgi:hypothetical protein